MRIDQDAPPRGSVPLHATYTAGSGNDVVAIETDTADTWAAITEPHLRAAARQVMAQLGYSNPARSDDAELAAELILLARAVAGTAALGEVVPPTAIGRVERRRLLDLLRHATLGIWRECPPPAAEMIAWLDSFERIQTALEPRWCDDFATYLSMPTSFELLVEVAHDLRSPLTSILFLSEVLLQERSGEVNEVQHRQLGIIYSAALGLLSMASDMIEFARGGNQLLDQEATDFSVAEIFDSVKDIVQPMAEEKGLALRLYPPPVDRRRGHPVALSRALLNLTTNALKFTDEGMVELVARPRGTRHLEFSVRDTGPGIDPEVMQSLYRPFRRSPGRERYHFSGSGLGLVITRRLVEAMGSRLEFETDPKWGTRFHFVLELPPVRANGK